MKADIALIGCGRIGFLLENDPLRYKPCTHYGGALSAGLRISHACDINEKRLFAFAKKAKIPAENTFLSHHDLFASVKPAMAIIATWTESHERIAVDAAKNGVRIIVLEKPIAPSLHQSLKILKACIKNKTSLIINHERRYDARYRQLKKIIVSGKIGEMKTVYASILNGGYRGVSNLSEGGGPLLHDGTHIIDTIRFLFGEIACVQGEFQRKNRTKGFEDRAVAWMKTRSNIDIFLEAGGSRNYFVFELEISGSEGKIVIGNGYEKMQLKKKSRLYTGFNDLAEVPFPIYKKNNCFKELYREAKTILTGKSGGITSTGLDGHKDLEIIHAIYLSSHLKKNINLPLKPGIVNIAEIFKLK